MGLIVGAAELLLFATLAGVCVMLVLTVIFAVLGTVGLRFDADGDDIVAATIGTMILWGVMLVVGGICSFAGATGPWIASPLGSLQGVLWAIFKPHLAPEPHTWANDYSGMWATFWSYCVVSLFASLLVVGSVALHGTATASKDTRSD